MFTKSLFTTSQLRNRPKIGTRSIILLESTNQ
jgi:hypothetical protein